MRKKISFILVIALCMMLFPFAAMADNNSTDPAYDAYQAAYDKYFTPKGYLPSPANNVNRIYIYVSVPTGADAASIGLTTVNKSNSYTIGCYETYGTLPWASSIKNINPIEDTDDINALLYNATLQRGTVNVNGKDVTFYNTDFDMNRLTLTWYWCDWNVYEDSTSTGIYSDGTRVALIKGIADKFKYTVNYPDGTSTTEYYKVGDTIPQLQPVPNTDDKHFVKWVANKTNGDEVSLPTTMPAYDVFVSATMEDHSWDSGVVTTDPACEVDGVRTYTCTECAATKTGIEPQTGHTPVTDLAVAATCVADGKTEGSHCDVCEVVIVPQQVIPMTGHKDADEDYVCDICGAELPNDTTPTPTSVVTPTDVPKPTVVPSPTTTPIPTATPTSGEQDATVTPTLVLTSTPTPVVESDSKAPSTGESIGATYHMGMIMVGIGALFCIVIFIKRMRDKNKDK